MLNLIRCEFFKLKRKPFLWGLLGLSALLPLLLVFYELPNQQGMTGLTQAYKAGRFDYYCQCLCVYAFVLLMPCLVGVLSCFLFFMERDNDTFKNLRAVPVTAGQLVFAKVLAMLLLELLFSTLLFGFLALFFTLFGIDALTHGLSMFWMCEISGLLLFAASLPVVVLVVFFNGSTLISLLLSFFCSILGWASIMLLAQLANVDPRWKLLFSLHPSFCTMQWTSWFFRSPAEQAQMMQVDLFVPDTGHTLLLDLGVAAVSLALVLRYYKRWTR